MEPFTDVINQRTSIEDLKAQWKADPCWDIEDTDGFENVRQELLVWRLTYERDQYRDCLHELTSALRVIGRAISH